MNRTEKVMWLAGLFEGEGCFGFDRGKPRSMSIQMTDHDVLLRVQEWFGGKIYECSVSEIHHKTSWRWSVQGKNSVDIAGEISPFLLSRRSNRCQEYIDKYRTHEDRVKRQKAAKSVLYPEVFRLRGEGLTHSQIAKAVGKERSYVTRILSGERVV